MLSQDEDGRMYVANSKGLLEFTGTEWTLYPSPNETTIRAVRAVGDRIYTGCYREFGYWLRAADGQLTYHSLATAVRERMRADEHFWNIIAFEGRIVFQSLDQLFLYNPATEAIDPISPEAGVDKLFRTDAGLYFTDRERHLFQLREGSILPVSIESATDVRVIHLRERDGSIMLQTAINGPFKLAGNSLQALTWGETLRDKKVYSALPLADGGLAVGTISNGVYIFGADDRLRYHISQTDGLTNNTVLSLYQDTDRNLWVGTDNGISCINLDAPFHKFTDNSGKLGTVYTAHLLNGRLYLGTNQGLFIRSAANDSGLMLIPGTQGQVWSLFERGGQLFCGHDSGTFLVEGDRATLLFDQSGTWGFATIKGRPDLLLQGNYYGLSVLELKNGSWQFRNQISGFEHSARFFTLLDEREIYVSHEYRGLFGLRLDEDLRRVTERQDYEQPAKGKDAGLIGFQNGVIYLSREGCYRLSSFQQGFRRDSSLSERLSGPVYQSGKLSLDSEGRLWVFTRDRLVALRAGTLDERLRPESIPVPIQLLKAMAGYENIAEIGRDSLLIGTADGYLILSPSELPSYEHRIFLSGVTSREVSGSENRLPLAGGVALPYQANNLSASFAVPSYGKYFVPRFQYRLTGFYNEWSEWAETGTVSFRNLPFGNYQLEVRSLLGERQSENTLRYDFQILRPWYWSHPAIAIYVLAICLLIYLTHRTYTGYYRNKEKAYQLENERHDAARRREAELETIRLNNEQLQLDIDNKNRELAISTMNLVKKNELLHQIKADLQQKGEKKADIRGVMRTIDRNTDEAETWNLFREAFENADRDFFKKVCDRHPDLTPNDLKLCAYLRLNLSSKEIAPLLNISVRSVEVKRYRLRKKMDLNRDDGLVEHMLSF